MSLPVLFASMQLCCAVLLASLVTPRIAKRANPRKWKRHLPLAGAVKIIVPFLRVGVPLKNRVHLLIDYLLI